MSARTERPRFRIGIDTGGTFTDVVAVDEATGAVYTTKTPSTPHDPAAALLAGVRKIMAQAGFGPEQVAVLSHGTTVATNALLEERFDGLGFITTRGFRFLLEIARQSVPAGYGNSYFWVKPERIVPLERVREVTERLDHRGAVLVPFDEAEAAEVVRWFKRRGVSALGVCFLHSYANPEHERRMGALIAREYPEAAYSLSSEVLPEYREYERAMTTLVDAYVKPTISAYVERVARCAREELGAVPFLIMKSNGGVVSAHEVAARPSATVLSGPAAGALGAAFLAQAAGFDRVLTLDAGGTSTDICLVERGEPHLTTQGKIGRFPIKTPMLDVVSIGTGGGSIAWIGPEGGLRVGPRSAGADPGPICYGRGGTEPTLTDANLVLGRIPPRLLGGEVPLDPERARAGIARLAERLGLDPVRAAAGIVELANWNQANAVRQVTTRKGLDVRAYSLVAFGGSGPLQAGRLVEILGLAAAVIPPAPGNVSAFGLEVVDLKNDFVVTAVQRADRLDLDLLRHQYARLEAEARASLEREGIPPERMVVQRSADLRYFGQAWEVRVELPPGELDADLVAATVERFHAAHERQYGYSYRGQQVPEWVNLRVTGVGPLPRPRLRELPAAGPDPSAARSGARPVYCEAAGGFVPTPIFDRARLLAGNLVAGPAVIEEYGSTTVVLPGQHVLVDHLGNLLLRPDAPSR